ncbi:MAG: response regulator transcription factor [Christensenellales bacterium]|jgi:two-component system alkaline phosphatase synthesis response regulator PhoP
MARILIAEDDLTIAELVATTLGVSGHTAEMCHDGAEALRLITARAYDLAIVDVMMPGLDGFTLLERLKAQGAAVPPVLYLTARIDVNDRVRGLRLGAEDYMLKPFHPVELQARVDGILTRHGALGTALSAYDVTLDTRTHTVSQRGQPVDMTPQEFALLHLFMRHKNMALSREQLLEAAWGYDYLGGTRTVDVHVQRLRSKLGWEDIIKTVYKLGYRLDVPQ